MTSPGSSAAVSSFTSAPQVLDDISLNSSCAGVSSEADLSLTQEFKALPKPPSSRRTACEVFGSAIIPENTCKNRYPDVLPYEEHRVKLRTGTSDYINASYIRGLHARSYISCQAPLPQTFEDFWVMIWENDIPLVVMLTRFLEKRQIKAHCYWPQELGCSEEFGDLSLMLTSVRKLSPGHITLRTFRLTHMPSGDVRDVAHIHYTEWPDFGVPKSSTGIRQVVKLMDMYNSQCPERSIVVHCSAGIGRTGTLLAVHSFLARHRGDTNVTVREIVEDMRKHRMGMVQTKEQYRFIYQAIEDALKQNSRMGVQPDREGESGESSTSQPPKRNWRTRSSPAIRTSAEMGVSY